MLSYQVSSRTDTRNPPRRLQHSNRLHPSTIIEQASVCYFQDHTVLYVLDLGYVELGAQVCQAVLCIQGMRSLFVVHGAKSECVKRVQRVSHQQNRKRRESKQACRHKRRSHPLHESVHTMLSVTHTINHGMRCYTGRRRGSCCKAVQVQIAAHWDGACRTQCHGAQARCGLDQPAAQTLLHGMDGDDSDYMVSTKQARVPESWQPLLCLSAGVMMRKRALCVQC